MLQFWLCYYELKLLWTQLYMYIYMKAQFYYCNTESLNTPILEAQHSVGLLYTKLHNIQLGYFILGSSYGHCKLHAPPHLNQKLQRFCLSMQALLFLCATLAGNKFTATLTSADLVITLWLLTGTFDCCRWGWRLVNPAGRLMLDRSGLLPSTVLMQAAFQKDES